jgi:hypothetical protein
MSRSVQGRRPRGEAVRLGRSSGGDHRPQPVLASGGSGPASPRLIGLPLAVSVPTITGIRWRYCTRWEEQPAAQLGKSLLRLGICHTEDWSGSAVDFVERGFRGFAKDHGTEDAAKVWEGYLRIVDYPFYLSELERNQSQAETAEPRDALYLVGEYTAAASIPIGATLALLEHEHERLPAAFYTLFVHNLGTWMRVYDYERALWCAEMWLEGVDEEEASESFYPKVAQNIPACLRETKPMAARTAVRFLKAILPDLRRSQARQLVEHVLDMEMHRAGREHAWPGKLAQQVPGLEEFLSDADESGPGCLITWHEDDEINACFDEEMQALGQNAPMEPSMLMTIALNKRAEEIDANVKHVFGYIGAMLRSLASAAQIVAIIRDIYDEHLRRNRLKSGLQVETGVAGVRGE